ncbi:MAG: hypothetical protein QOI73_3645 [Solirubrobacteraceae bacterium]|nr:hypothetical protein [Solirubrobacteraceae bacterium]
MRRSAGGELAWAWPLAIVVPMLALASALGTHEIIFPEGAALVMGIWVVGLPGWSASRWRTAVLPPLFAVAGVLLLRLDLAQTTTALIAVTLGLIALALADSRLAPALSAAVLPIVFDVRAWSYPLSVLAISLVVAAAMPCFAKPGPHAAGATGRYPWRVAGGAWLAICAWILAGGELLSLSSVVLAPPLFVSALEWLGREDLRAHDGLRRWGLMIGAGLAGSGAVALVPLSWLSGSLAVIATLALMRLLRTPHPPALAIALIPQLLRTVEPLDFTLSIAAGAGALYLGVLCVERVQVAAAGRKLVGVQDGEHRELMMAAIATEGEAHAALLAGEHDAARASYARAVEQYRASWRLAPPKSYGRLVGLLKAAVLGGQAQAAATEVRGMLDGDADAEGSPVASYVLAVAALIDGDEDEVALRASRMQPRGEAFERTATALKALAARDGDAYEAALTSIEADFAARDEHLTGVAIADTAVMLELLAAERGMAVRPSSPLMPAV